MHFVLRMAPHIVKSAAVEDQVSWLLSQRPQEETLLLKHAVSPAVSGCHRASLETSLLVGRGEECWIAKKTTKLAKSLVTALEIKS